MDFKVSGTQRGVTAVQLDLKGRGLPQDIVIEAFAMAKRQAEILRQMLATPSARAGPTVRSAHLDDADQSGEDR